jgi:hypothetical protein
VPAALIATALLLSLPKKPADTFLFAPKVGEKFYYSLEMTDEKGAPMMGELKPWLVFKVAGVRDGIFTVITNLEVKSEGGGQVPFRYQTYYVNREGKWRMEKDTKADKFDFLTQIVSTTLDGYTPGLFVGKNFEANAQLEESFKMSDLLQDMIAKTGFDPSVMSIKENGRRISKVKKLTAEQVQIENRLDLSLNIGDQDEKVTHLDMMLKVQFDTTYDRSNGMPFESLRRIEYKVEEANDGAKGVKIERLKRTPKPTN